MPEQPQPPAPQRVRVEDIDWTSLLPFTHLFGSFRMAVHPPKLLLSLLIVVLVFLGGQVLDLIWGPRVYPDEVQRYATLSPQDFSVWVRSQDEFVSLQLQRLLRNAEVEGDPAQIASEPNRFRAAAAAINSAYDARRDRWAGQPDADPDLLRDRLERLEEERSAALKQAHALRPRGVFAASLRLQIDSFERMIRAATALNFGITSFGRGNLDPDSVLGALRTVVITFPGWLLARHPWFMLMYAAMFLAIWSLLAGAVTRLAATHATRNDRSSAGQALAFAFARWVWFVLAPLIPLLLVLVVGLLLGLFGLVFFNLMVTDILGGLLFVLAILGGVVIALLLVGLAASAGMLYPAIAVEGSDAFDAISRAFNYVLGRPWRWLFYNAVALVYGAVAYLFVYMVLFVALSATQYFVDVGAFADAAEGVDRFTAIMPPPQLAELTYNLDLGPLDWSGKASAVLVRIWANLLIAVLAAFVISFFLCAQTWIYLLLRRSADGTATDDVYTEPTRPEPPAPAAKEPAPTEPAAAAKPADDEASEAASPP